MTVSHQYCGVTVLKGDYTCQPPGHWCHAIDVTLGLSVTGKRVTARVSGVTL